MSIGEAHTLGSQPVHVGSANEAPGGVVGLDIPIAEVVGINDDDMGRGCSEGP